MSKIGHWKKILGHTEKGKVPVSVGGRIEQMTDTQSFRFDELEKNRETGTQIAARNPLEQSRYTLEDASFRLLITEDQLMKKAAAGFIRLYTNATGLTGRWRRGSIDGSAAQSSVQTLKSGFLALDARSCGELATAGRTLIAVLDFCGPIAHTNIEGNTLATLNAWGPGSKQFVLQESVMVNRDKLVLLAPLVFTNGRSPS